MLVDTIFARAQARPRKTALIHNGVACSYAGFARRIAAAHGVLAAQGLPAGSCVVLCMNDLAAAWVAGIAARRLGLDTVSVPDASELEALRLRGASGVLSAEGGNEPDLSGWSLASRVARLRMPALEPAAGEGDAGPGRQAAPAGARREGAHILLTSGTTGINKKVRRDPVADEPTLIRSAQSSGITEGSVVYVRDFPLATAGGYRWPLQTWMQGGTVVFQQGGDYQRPYADVELSHAFSVPHVLSWDLRHFDGPRRDGMRLLVTGGAMSAAQARAARDKLTRQVYALYASTEALSTGMTLIESDEDLNWHRILPGRTVEVVDGQGRALPPGQRGEVRIRIEDGLRGYMDDAAASAQFFRDGWFHPGDLGLFGPDGRLALQGRATEVINVHGSKIAVAPMERTLENALGVDTVCIFSARGADSEDVHVVIQGPRPADPSVLRQLSRQSPFNRFPRAHFHFVQAMPRNRMGKVLRAELQQRLLGRAGG